MHRATGVFLSVICVPLLLWWLVALGNGASSYESFVGVFSGLLGYLLIAACLFSLCFHFFNGIRHLIWDSGRMLDLKNAYLSGWLVLIASLLCSALLMGVLI